MGACLRTSAEAGRTVVIEPNSRARSSNARERQQDPSALEHADSSLSLNSGTQVLSDKALRKLVRGSFFRVPKILSKKASGASRPKEKGGKASCSQVRFGQDCVSCAEPRPGLECGICFSRTAVAKRWCGNRDCKAAFCDQCLGQYVTGKIADALHFAPPVNCPETSCRRRIATAVWAPAVEQGVRQRYHANASALLAIRCPRCDEVKSLLREPLAAPGSQQVEEEILGVSGTSLQALRQDWLAFCKGEVSADQVLTSLLKGAGGRAGPEGEPPACVRRMVDAAAGLMVDEERRVCMQLAFLRRFPKLRTPCCSAKMCFKCKVAGWHPRVSCEARQQRFVESASGVQCCPSCGIPTQRTEGCLQMDCVCGKSWQWQNSEEEMRERERTFTPLPLACLGIPGAVTLQFLQMLLGHKADLSLTRQSDGWTAAHFAAVARSDREGVHVPDSDASRLEVLVKLMESGGPSVDLDAADMDGDTPLSVAVAGGNVAGARLLAGKGAKFRKTVWESLETLTPAADRLEMRAILKPLLTAPGNLTEEVAPLPLWLEFGEEENSLKAIAALQPGEAIDESVAGAFAWGLFRESGKKAGEKGPSAAVAGALESAFGEQQWQAARASAATRMLWRLLESGWPHRVVDVAALKSAVGAGARIWTKSAEDEESYALSAALERQEPGAVEVLLGAGAAPPQLLEEGGEDGPLGPGYVRALELLSPARAVPIAKALGPALESVAESSGRDPPLWLCVQLGMKDRVERLLKNGAEVGAEEAAAAIKRTIFNLHEGVSRPYQQLEQVKAACGSKERWAELQKGASTALLHLELHQAHNFERNPDLKLCRRLLADFTADPSGLSGSLGPDFSGLAEVSSNGENLTPLMLLAANCYMTADMAKSAAELLIEFKADPNQPDEDGDTALFWALLQQQASVAEVLARSGGQLADSSVDRLQAWSHPAHLRPLAAALAPQLQKPPVGADVDEGWPAWLQVQFGLSGARKAAEAVEGEEALREVVEALLLSNCCGAARASSAAVEAALTARLGEERLKSLKAEASSALLGREVVGAFGGKWPLDNAWVRQLLEAGADVNMLLDLGDSAEPEDEWGDDDGYDSNSEDPDDDDDDEDDDDDDSETPTLESSR